MSNNTLAMSSYLSACSESLALLTFISLAMMELSSVLVVDLEKKGFTLPARKLDLCDLDLESVYRSERVN